MKWSVTGANGFIGFHLVKALKVRGHEVWGSDIEWDITNFDNCLEICDADIVIHLAALSTIGLCEQHPQGAEAINVRGFQNMMRASKASGVQRFLYASTGLVGLDDSLYVLTKANNESYASIMAKDGLKSLGLRYFNVYGPGQNPKLGHVLPTWLEAYRNEMPAFINGDGTTVRDYIYIDDVVDKTIELAQTDVAGVMEVGSGVGTSLNELFALAQNHLPGIRSVYDSLRPGEAMSAIAKTRSGAVSLVDGLKRTLC